MWSVLTKDTIPLSHSQHVLSPSFAPSILSRAQTATSCLSNPYNGTTCVSQFRPATKVAPITFDPAVLTHGILRHRTVDHSMPCTMFLFLCPLAIALLPCESSDRLKPHTLLHFIMLCFLPRVQLSSLVQKLFKVARHNHPAIRQSFPIGRAVPQWPLACRYP